VDREYNSAATSLRVSGRAGGRQGLLKGLSMYTRTSFSILTVLAILPFGARVAYAQALNGSVVGNVRDTSDAMIAGATVTLTNADTGQARTVTTTSTGAYDFATVPPGTYELKASREGFSNFVQNAITIAAGALQRVDVTLKVGGVSETVEVSARPAVLQSDSAEVRHELDTGDLGKIPLPAGRNYQSLLSTVPGFTPPTNQHSVGSNPSRGLYFAVNGGDHYQNNTRIDGASTMNVWLPDIVALLPTLESIASVNVATNSFDAETGFTGGGNVGVQTKSGTNQLHAAIFEDHTDNDLKARPFFLPSNQRKGKLVYNEFGAAGGGRIVRDKLFYFLSYEGSTDHEYGHQLQTVPTAAIKSGDMSGSTTPIYDPGTGTASGAGRTPFAGNSIPASRIDPIALSLSNLLPLPNVPGSALTNNYDGSGNYTYGRHRGDAKMNWNPTSRLTTFARFSMLRFSMVDPPVFGVAAGGIDINPQGGQAGTAIGETYSLTASATYLLTPTLIVDGYFGWENDNTAVEPFQIGKNIGQQLGIPGTNGPARYQTGMPWFNVSSYGIFGTAGSQTGGFPYYRDDAQHQEVLNASWTHGAHDLRFGTEIQQQFINNLQPSNAQGAFSFSAGPTQISGGPSGNQYNSYATFLLGLVTSANQTVVYANPPSEPINQHWYSAYIRDRWTVSRKFTVSLGLRWDYYGFPNARFRGIGAYDIASNRVGICGAGQVSANCGVSMPKRLFSPRIGLAYRLTDTFVIRAGYGINEIPFSLGRSVLSNYPTTISPNYVAANSLSWYGTLGTGLPPIALPPINDGYLAAPPNVNMSVLPKSFPWPYTQTWNLTLQKELRPGFSVQTGYVGSRTVRAMTQDIGSTLNLNAGQTIGAGVNGQPFYASQGRTANVSLFTPRGTVTYDSLQTTVNRRFAQGFQLGGAWTWSKAESPVYLTDALLYQGVNARAVQSSDRTHVLTINGTWELPFGKGKTWLSGSGAGSAILGGWSVNSLTAFYSGLPFTVTASATSLNMPGATQRADQVKPNVAVYGNIGGAYFDPLAFAAVTAPRFGTAGAFSMRGPGEVNVDFGLTKVITAREKYNIQFRAEALNLTNTPHFANPNANVSNLVLNGDGSVKNLAGFAQVQAVANTGRDGIDERQIRFFLRIGF
jgi:hypothetical protein